jgi:hypothetical protein
MPAAARLTQRLVSLWLLAVRGALYLWASPVSLLGLLLGAAGLAGGSRARIERGVLELSGGRLLPLVLRVLGPTRRIAALTLGHVVLARTSALMDATRDHERVHVRQYERWGPLFLPLYFASSAMALLAGADPYHDNRFERQAFEADRDGHGRPA